MLRFLLWRTLAALATLAAIATILWLLSGGPGHALRKAHGARVHLSAGKLWAELDAALRVPAPRGSLLLAVWTCAALGAAMAITLVLLRGRARRRRCYVRLRVAAYIGDGADEHALGRMYAMLHAALAPRWFARLVHGAPSVSLEVHYLPGCDGSAQAWLAVALPRGLEAIVEASLRCAYPNCRLEPCPPDPPAPLALARLKKGEAFIGRTWTATAREERDPEPTMNRVLTTMGACGVPASLQLALTPAPAFFERVARHRYRRHEAHISRARREHVIRRDRSMLDEAYLRGAMEIQYSPLFFADVRILAPTRADCERIAAPLRAQRAENRLVERGTRLRQGVLGAYGRRVRRGEGNPLPDIARGVLAAPELAALWHLPSIDYSTVPFERSPLPLAPAPPAIQRPAVGGGTLRDALGPVSIEVAMRRQNTAVPGTVEQGKSSYLVATVAEDLRRERCAVIVLDPKGDAADAALSAVPPGRACTLLDFACPTCGFNPLAVDAPADVIADYVVAALKTLFTDAEIRASSDRYLRNAIIAVLAHDRRCTLWDAARLLSVGEEGYAYRRLIGGKVRAMPELKEISTFFTDELSAQLADARGATTSKLDAPVNKLARLLNSASIKRILLNDHLRVDFDRLIAGREVLVVKGALGAMGAGNTSVLMQLLVGMLDAALARQQDLVEPADRVAVALKVDEAPLVLNRSFAETMALKRSAGLETVACWQTDAQWPDREVRDQLDALFAHRVYFATASSRDARAAVALAMARFSDSVRPETPRLSELGRPEVRLRLPRHRAIASWTTPAGRQPAFIAETIPMHLDERRLAHHAAAQARRGGRLLEDLRQPHWERESEPAGSTSDGPRRGSKDAPRARPEPSRVAPTPERPAQTAESYRELVELDHAQSVRRAGRAGAPRAIQAEPLDLAILELLASFEHLLSTQIHRRFNAEKAMTTTQRRLKRLTDAGLVQRLQFHRADGGGVPMCYALSAAGAALLNAHGRLDVDAGTVRTPATDADTLRSTRRQLHAAAWALAMRALAPTADVHGSAVSAIPVPRARAGGPYLTPEHLRLAAGRVPHDFLRTNGRGERLEVDRFESLRPDATITIPAERGVPASDLLVHFIGGSLGASFTATLERYDHFLAGWSLHTPRYGERARATPTVVIVCRDREAAHDCALHADPLLGACRAYAGDYPAAWEYPGRASTVFVAERDVHEGHLDGWSVPLLPPVLRSATEQQGAQILLERKLPA